MVKVLWKETAFPCCKRTAVETGNLFLFKLLCLIIIMIIIIIIIIKRANELAISAQTPSNKRRW